eukprot:scaffold834_cov123-Cylindrotheca_fusiformis.AAC.19
MLKLATLVALLVLNKSVLGQDQTIGWFIPENGQMDPITMHAGDTLTFNYTDGNHEVYIHPLGNCSEDGRVFVGERSAGPASYTFKDSEIGTNVTFACDYVNHCEYGQIINVEVLPSSTDCSSTRSSSNPLCDSPTIAPNDSPTATAPTGDRGTNSAGDAVAAPWQTTTCAALFIASLAMFM